MPDNNLHIAIRLMVDDISDHLSADDEPSAESSLRGTCGMQVSYFQSLFGGQLRSCLHPPCCPSAVFRCVRTIIVNAVQTVRFGRTLAHVIKKQCERVPSITNCDASAPIPMEVSVVGIEASLTHAGPTLIFGRYWLLTMSRAMFSYALTLKTTTTTLPARFQVRAPCNKRHLSTITIAQPASMWSSRRRKSDNHQPTKSLTSQIFSFRHSASIVDNIYE